MRVGAVGAGTALALLVAGTEARGEGEATVGTSAAVSVVPEDAYRTTDTLIWVNLGLSVLHHTDHAVRDNHSGFPFTSHVTALTPTLIVYPLVIGGIVLDAGPLYWTIFDAASLVGVIAIHLTVEPPRDIYDPWADGTNLLGVESPAMGGVALAVLGGLMAGLTAHMVASIVEGRRYGFTWKQKPPGTILARPSPVAFAATPNGQLWLSFRW